MRQIAPSQAVVDVTPAETSRNGALARPGYVTYHGVPEPPEEPQSSALLEYWRIIRNHKGTLIVFAFAALLLGVLATLPQTPVYQARGAIEVQSLNQNFLNSQEVNPMSESSPLNLLTDVQTQIRILQSESLSDRVLEKLRHGKYGDGKYVNRVSAWRHALNLPQAKDTGATEAILKRAVDTLGVRAAGQTRVIEITSDSTDPKLASDFINMLISEFIDQNIESRWQMSQKTAEWLNKQLEEMRIRLEKSEESLQTYARQSGLMFTGGDEKNRTNISEDKLAQLQAELSKAQAERIARQSKYELVKSTPADTLADVIDDAALRDYDIRLTDLRRQLAELTITYTAEDRRVKRLQAQIDAVQTAQARQRGNILDRIKTDYDETTRREKLLSASYAAQAALVTDEASRSVQYNILKREVESNRQLYESMLQRVKESSIASAMRASNIRIVDPAKVPERAYKPRVVVNAAVALMGGLFVGIVFVVYRERADRTLQEPGDASYFLNIPELGVIPSADTTRKTAFYGVRKRIPPVDASEEGSSGSTVPVKTGTPRVELITHQYKPSLVAESFRAVLTSILFSGNNGSRPRVLVVTSANPGEGKTTVTSNLAIATAELQRKVLVVDADLRKPRMHDIFGVNNERGLSQILENQELADEILAGMIQETAVANLYVIPAGPCRTSASNLLHSGVLPKLLQRMRGEFDMVLVDTPPMLHMPDARVAGRLSDAVVLVARSNRTTRDAAQAAVGRFKEDGTRVLGAILDDWTPASHSTYGGYAGSYRAYQSTYGAESRS